jgi:hypothetical protein
MKALFLIFAICFGTLNAFSDGGWSGNGGNSAQDKDNVWFLGDEAIPYCVIANHPTYSKPAVEMMIQKSVAKWRDFFERYQMDQFQYGANSYRMFPDKVTRGVSLNWAKSTNCIEVEKYCQVDNTDSQQCHQALKSQVLFLIGTPNKVIENYLTNNGSATAVALRTDYDHHTFRSGGIVWVGTQKVNGWDQLSHMILHEIGHVLGMKHDSCWVMNSDVAQMISSWNGIGNLNSIEAPNWPYSYSEGDQLIFTDSRIRVGNFPKGFYPNIILENAGLNELLGFDKSAGFQVRGRIIKERGDLLDIGIEIEESPSGKVHSVIGSIRRQGEDAHLVPEIFTAWQSNSNPPSWRSESYEGNYNGFKSNNLIGLLDWNNKKVSVVLRREKGLRLNLYFPDAKDWLTLNTVEHSR